jgi:hypothetical protein
MRTSYIFFLLMLSISCKANSQEFLSLPLKEALKMFIADPSMNSKEDKSLIIIGFSQENDDCVLYLIRSSFYNREKVMSSLIFEDNNIVVYYPINDCFKGILNYNTLKKELNLSDFKEESVFLKENDVYDPKGYKYKIDSKGNLKLV